MAMGPLIGALFEGTPPKSRAAKGNPKPRKNKTTMGEKSVASNQAQQHGELAYSLDSKPATDRTLAKDHAKSSMRRATEDWVEGRLTTKEHVARHERAKHVLKGKSIREFKGTTGERHPGKMGKGHLW